MPKPSFKQALLDLLQNLIQQQTPLTISWNCMYCDDFHSGNLFKKVCSILDGPEIQLQDETGGLFAVIAISKNKRFNEQAADVYRAQHVIYIQVSPTVEGAKTVLESISRPIFVSTCLNPKCEKCNGFKHGKSIFIIDAKCWKCEFAMKVAVLDTTNGRLGPDAFNEEELTLARSMGVLIKNNYSKTVGSSYLSNTCPSCDALTGNHYLFTEYYTEALYGTYSYEQLSTGYMCQHCFMED